MTNGTCASVPARRRLATLTRPMLQRAGFARSRSIARSSMRVAAKYLVVLVSVVLSLTILGAARPAPTAAAQPSGVPANAVERNDLRTATSRTFQLADGKMMTQLYDKPIFYQPDGSSSWQPIDTHLSVTADHTSALSADRAPSRIAFGAAGSALGFLRLRGGGHAINIGLPTALRAMRAASTPQSQEDGSYAEYADFLPGGVDLRVFPETDGYSMFLVLSARPSSNSFSFTIDAPGLRLGADPLGTPDALAFTDAAGNVIAEMPRPYMQDSSYVEGLGSGLYSEAVSMSYTGSNGHWLLTLSIDPAFLDTASYPVYVDPSVTSFPNANASAQDTFASSKYPGSNFNTYHRPDSPYYHEMWLGNEPGTSYYNQVFMRFQDLDTVLGDVDIDSAYLEFYPYWQYWHSDPRQSQMNRITSSWQQNQLTWNNRPTVDVNPYMTFYTTQGQFSHVDVTQYVQDVVNGTWVDHGLQLNADTMGQGGWKRIVSLDDTDLSLRPHLDVTWEESDEGTGIDPDDVPDLTYEDMGYSQADVDARNAELQAYDLRDPTGLVVESPDGCILGDEESCGGGGPILTADRLSGSFTIFHQQDPYWCLPAVDQSILAYLRPSDNWSGATIAQVEAKQAIVVDDILAKRNAKKSPDIDEIGPPNGVGTRWALAAVNQDLHGSYKYQETRAQSSADMRQRTKMTINKDIPVFLEINLRSKSWVYSIGPAKDGDLNHLLTHATAAVAYTNSGASLSVDDPYPTSTYRTVHSDYYTIPTYDQQTPGPYGVEWPITDFNLYTALAKYNKGGGLAQNMWY